MALSNYDPVAQAFIADFGAPTTKDDLNRALLDARTSTVPASLGQLLGGGNAGQAVPIAVGSGLALSGGTLSATGGGSGSAGVATWGGRAGAVTMTLSDVTGVTGTGSAARAALGLAAVAASGAYSDLSGTPTVPALASTAPLVDGAASAGTSGAAARADHIHPTDTSRLGASAIPAASGALLGGSGTAGAAIAITVGAGLALNGGTLTATGGGSSGYTLPPATTTQLGGVKPDGTTLTTTSDGTITVVGIAIDALTSAGTLQGSDAYVVRRSGTDYQTTLTATATFVRGTLATVATSGAYSDLTGTPTIPAASTTTPLMDGAAAIGSGTSYALSNHVHPTDTTRLGVTAIPTASGALLGGSGTAGQAGTVAVGSGLTLASGTLATLASLLDNPLKGGFTGLTVANQKIAIDNVLRPALWPASTAGFSLQALTAAAASTVFTLAIKRGGTTIAVATCTVAAGATTGTWSAYTQPTEQVGDLIYMAGPTTPDTQLADGALAIPRSKQ